MKINLWLTKPGVYVLIAAVIVGAAFVLVVDVWVKLPPEWKWMDWDNRRRRTTLWDFLVIAAGFAVGCLFFWLTSFVLGRFGIKVHGRDPTRPRRRRKRYVDEESWEIQEK
jgi:hypothetical protein